MTWDVILEHSANVAEILAGIAIVYSVVKVLPSITRDRKPDWSDELEQLRLALSRHKECSPIADLEAAALAIVRTASGSKSTDIHIGLKQSEQNVCGIIRFRQQGKLTKIHQYPENMHAALVASFRSLIGVTGNEGRLSISEPRPLDARVQIAPALLGESLSVRLLDRQSANLPFEAIGLPASDLEKLKRRLSSPEGLVICSGPLGSGKVVVLYTSLNSLDHNARSIVTVENPIEIELPNITQLSCTDEPGRRLQDLFKVAMRMDPDVLMIGEIADATTANYCYRAATTGQLVMTTAHSLSAIETLSMLDNYLDELMPRNIMISNQRLTRRLCQHCAVPHALDQSDQALIVEICELGQRDPDGLAAKFLQPVGCEHCDTGFQGRLGGYELMEVSEGILSALRASGMAAGQAKAVSEGMTPTSYRLLAAAAKGQTTLNEIRRVCDFG